MKIPISKFKAILLYFANNTNKTYLGKVKLMKLFYFLDFIHLKKYGSLVTYDEYYHLEKGPIPTVIKNIVDEASEDTEFSNLADTVYFETPANTVMKRCIPIREFSEEDAKLFSQSELIILQEVCSRFGNYITQDIIDASHKESAWSKTEYRQKIPFELAGLDPDSQFSQEELSVLISAII